jgi:hypothetical protein
MGHPPPARRPRPRRAARHAAEGLARGHGLHGAYAALLADDRYAYLALDKRAGVLVRDTAAGTDG